MSEGSITYKSEGTTCGITTVINSQLRNHEVCNDGLACMEQYFDENQEVLIKKCSSVDLPPGTSCNPLYTNCAIGLECMRNEYEQYTCGGCTVWLGNDDAINSQIITTSRFEPNITMVIIGFIILFCDCLLYLGLHHKKKTKGQFEKITNSKEDSIY